MDPETTYRLMLSKAAAVLDAFDKDDEPDPDDVSELANAVENLNKWLSSGGAKPKAWQ